MTEPKCPSLAELGIEPGSFIRKLNNQNHWNTYSNMNLSAAAQAVAEKVFGERGEIYSLWKVNTEQEFYGVVAALTANATPRDRHIDFIWMAASELERAGILFKNVPEGRCIRVKDLHFNAVVTQKSANQLCHDLLAKHRSAQRCKKNRNYSDSSISTRIGL